MKGKVFITSASALAFFLVVEPVFAASFPANIPGPSVGRDTDGPHPFIYQVSEQRGDELRRMLTEQGYAVLNQDRTWLGRYRFVVRLNAQIREVIVHQHTGAILRNVLVETYETQATGQSTGTTEGTLEGVTGGNDGLGVGVDVGISGSANGGSGTGSTGGGIDVDVGGGGVDVDVDVGGGGVDVDLGL